MPRQKSSKKSAVIVPTVGGYFVKVKTPPKEQKIQNFAPTWADALEFLCSLEGE